MIHYESFHCVFVSFITKFTLLTAYKIIQLQTDRRPCDHLYKSEMEGENESWVLIFPFDFFFEMLSIQRLCSIEWLTDFNVFHDQNL